MENKNLDDVTTKDGVKTLFLKHQIECHLTENLEVLSIKRQLVLSPDTYAMLYEIDDNGTIKNIRVNASAKDSRKNAYDFMTKLSKIFSGPQLFIPKVYFYDQAYNAVAYENISGDLLIDLIKQKHDLDGSIALAGQWLKELHTKTKPVIIHGDYQPTNIIIKNNTISVFDFNDSKISATTIDVVSFLAQLRVMLLRFGSLGDYERLKDIFLANYSLSYDRELFSKLSKDKYLEIHNTLEKSMDEEEKPLLKEIHKFYKEI